MVSTRGGTRTAGADEKKESTLRKKPVRKTTAKAAPAASKAKATRSKKTEPEPQQEDDDEEDEIQLAEPPPKATRRAPAAKPEPTKRAATRPKKDEEPQKETAAKPATRTTKAASNATTAKAKAKGAKPEMPELPPPTTTTTKGTRATRATRATAAKERAPPLSPKKITQVSKAPAKNAKAAPKAKAPVAPSRPTTRKRAVSDENAEVVTPVAAEAESEDEAVAQKKQIATSKSKATNARARKPSPVEDETPASSRPTTPSDGIGQSFDGTEDEVAEASEEEQDEDDEDGDNTNNVSQDELCGPKTPMKRSSPRFGTQKSSRALDLGIPSKTPVRRFAVLGTQQGTPQTTKPYRQPNVPHADLGPTTVARARDRAMVFPKLQPLDLEADESLDERASLIAEESTPVPAEAEVDEVESDESVLDVTNAIEEDATQEPEPAEVSHVAHDPSVEVDDAVMEDDGGAEILDLDETIVVPDEEPESGPVSVTEDSFNSNDSVIVTRPTVTLEDVPSFDEQMQVDEMPTTTPKPETLVWENIREDVTIPFNFDVDFTLSRSLPQVEHNDRLSLANALASIPQDEADAVAGAEEDHEMTEDASSPEQVNTVADFSGQGQGRESLDATVNLSDFIDVKSLSESRRVSKALSNYGCEALDNAGGVQGQTSPTPGDVVPVEDVFDNEVFDDEDTIEATHSGLGDPEVLSSTPLTPARHLSELDIALNDLQQPLAPNTPRYAMPTISSRRKSLPAKLYPGTLAKDGIRPKTSDGVSIANIATPSRTSLRTRMPAISRPATAHALRSAAKPTGTQQTPRASKTPLAKTPGTSVPLAWQSATKNGTPFAKTPVSRTLFANTPATSVPEPQTQAIKERFPGLPSRSTYEVNAVVATPSAATPAAQPTPKERFPGMPPRDNYEDGLKTPQGPSTPLPSASTVKKSASKERFPGLPSKRTYEELRQDSVEEASEQPETSEPSTTDRFPGLPSRRTYEEHAKTAMPASRFRTPSHSPAKRPATVQKQASLRKVALKASTPAGSRTPMKTPLKAPAFTPGQVPMTPHPSAPLRGVVALVEVYTSDGDCATPAFAALLQRLGAKTTKTFSERLTHVVYKEGSPNTLQRLRIHNKQVVENGTGKEIHCVNSRWVTDCDAQGTRMPEADEAYAVEIEDVPRTAKRRRKSMEPMSLTNVKGSVFRNRQSSLGRSSLGRTPLRMDSPDEEEKTPMINPEDKENSGDDGSPATPAYLAAPDSLVQQTAPVNKVRKLDFKSQEAAKNRRLTFWNGRA
ncbi:hypothetical protein PRZ48_001333 [Zasmidium cellare]|uniref:BRCT domain-containing protein n=1 Tax=Zasmidium cellare TaxID=395010 RepID=A0ABR0F2V2_ZASCE|nr:hypothetical protein PRZ48_001333 [Zasmidium cellare]